MINSLNEEWIHLKPIWTVCVVQWVSELENSKKIHLDGRFCKLTLNVNIWHPSMLKMADWPNPTAGTKAGGVANLEHREDSWWAGGLLGRRAALWRQLWDDAMHAAASIACTAGIEREPEGRYHRWRSRGREREKDRLREADSDHTHLTPSPLRKTVQHLSEGRGEWAYSREKMEQKEGNAGHKKKKKKSPGRKSRDMWKTEEVVQMRVWGWQ